MPEMDGYQFYARVRENSAWHNIPFIFLSGKQETKFLRQSYASGADMFLPKTVAIDDLCAV
jgi:CheY-like chemotaxis protein